MDRHERIFLISGPGQLRKQSIAALYQLSSDSRAMLRHRFAFAYCHSPAYSPLLRPSFQSQCLHRRIPSPLIASQSPVKRPSSTSSLSPRSFLLPSLHKQRDRKVRKTKPLPVSPSRFSHSRRRSRLILYTLAFLLSGALTYTALQPDNHVNHVFHGIVRCSRIGVALVECVYDYRMTMRRKYTDEEEKRMDMSECHTRCATRTLKVFEKNGGIYIKLGQHLAALSYLIPIVSPSFLPCLLPFYVAWGCANTV